MASEMFNVITENTKIEGKLAVQEFTRFDGQLYGTVLGQPGSHFILSENGLVEGNITGDQITINGYIRGEIQATGKVTISATGRVIGNIIAASLAVEFGAFFEGQCSMPELVKLANA